MTPRPLVYQPRITAALKSQGLIPPPPTPPTPPPPTDDTVWGVVEGLGGPSAHKVGPSHATKKGAEHAHSLHGVFPYFNFSLRSRMDLPTPPPHHTTPHPTPHKTLYEHAGSTGDCLMQHWRGIARVARASLGIGEKEKGCVCVRACVRVYEMKGGGGVEAERTLCVTNKWKVARKPRGPAGW